MRADYETVVFDLDGTLVRLDVEWDLVAEEVAATLRSRGVEPQTSLWGMVETATEHELRSAVEAVIAAHEIEGAATSTRLPAAETVPTGPVGVCSLNCEAACREALSTHEIGDVSAVVGRDTVATEKPDPEPLLTTIERLGGDPTGSVFARR